MRHVIQVTFRQEKRESSMFLQHILITYFFAQYHSKISNFLPDIVPLLEAQIKFLSFIQRGVNTVSGTFF